MRKVWVLDTGTKGTGASVVPLSPEAGPKPRAPEPPAPKFHRAEPRPPEQEPPVARTFRVVDAMTEQVLADDVPLRAAVDALGDVRSNVDVRVYVREGEDAEPWRLLTLREQRALWDLRRRDPAHLD